MIIDENDLNLDLLIRIITKEIDDYYAINKKKKVIEDSISNLRYTIHMIKVKDYLLIKNQKELFEKIYFPILGETATKKILDKIEQHVSICLNQLHTPKKDQEKEFKEANNGLDNIAKQLTEILLTKKAELLSIGNQHTLDEIIELKRIRSNINFGHLITSQQYSLIQKVLQNKNLDTRIIILFLEHIKNHNTKIHLNNKNKSLNERKTTEIINMLSYGYEQIEIIDCNPDRKSQLDSVLNYITTISDKISNTDLIELLPVYNDDLKFTDNYELNDFSYLITNLLRYYQSLMFNNTTLLNNYNNYIDKDYRNMIVNDYYKSLNKYLAIRDFSEQQYKLYNDNLVRIVEEDNSPNILKLSYATKEEGNANKTFFEADLKYIPEDLYLRVKSLLIAFKKGKLSNTHLKALNSVYSGLFEIRDDQIRITYKHINDNEYAIVGVALKKEDNGRTIYKEHYKRSTQYTVSEELVEPILFEKIDLQSHKGGRKNT